MDNKTINLASFDSTLEDLDHYKFHINELKVQFDDMMIDRQPTGAIAFLSKKACSIADMVDFTNNSLSYSYNLHYARPYTEVETKCSFCIEKKSISKIRVACMPDRIPLFIESPGSNETFIYSMAFEDFLEQNGFSKNIVGKCRIYMIDFLKNKAQGAVKIDEIFINSSIKKVMAFS